MVSHMDLYSPAVLACKFVEGGDEIVTAEHATRQFPAPKLPEQLLSVDIGCSRQFEGYNGATAFGEIECFGENGSRINNGGFGGGHIGRGKNPGQTRLSEQGIPFPSFHRNDLEIASGNIFRFYPEGHLANSHPVTHWDLGASDECEEFFFQYRAVALQTADRIWPVKDINRYSGLGTR